jgi:hypothetical protein
MSSSLFERSISVQSQVSAAKRASDIVDATMHVFVRADIYRSLCWLSELMTLVQPHNYIASTETVPADSLTCSTVGLANFVILNGQAGIERLSTNL